MSRAFAVSGVPAQIHADYYQRRAKGGVGLLLGEATGINRPNSMNDPGMTVFHGDAPLAGWKAVLEGVHLAGGRMGPQLLHAGSVKGAPTDWEPASQRESPSGLVTASIRRGATMTDTAIADTIAAYAEAAAQAKQMGFDTVEIHGGHGYLVDQFFWASTNLREDRYGGAVHKDRSRFAAEVVAAIRLAVGPEFPIILRVSQWKGQDYAARMAATPTEMADWLTPLVDAGVDILHCSQRRFWEPEFPELEGDDGLNFAGWAKKLTGAATISVGSVGLSGDVLSAFAGEHSTPNDAWKMTSQYSSPTPGTHQFLLKTCPFLLCTCRATCAALSMRSMEKQLNELRSLTAKAENRRTETGIPRIAMVQGKVPEHLLAAVYDPMINVILQGSKSMTVGDRTLRYDPATYFVMSIDLPAAGSVHPSVTGEPYLAVSLTLDPSMLAALFADLPNLSSAPRRWLDFQSRQSPPS